MCRGADNDTGMGLLRVELCEWAMSGAMSGAVTVGSAKTFGEELWERG